MVHDRSSVPRSSRVLIKNISQKCSRDDHKVTLGGLHGHGMVQTSGVGPPMVPRGQLVSKMFSTFWFLVKYLHTLRGTRI